MLWDCLQQLHLAAWLQFVGKEEACFFECRESAEGEMKVGSENIVFQALHMHVHSRLAAVVLQGHFHSTSWQLFGCLVCMQCECSSNCVSCCTFSMFCVSISNVFLWFWCMKKNFCYYYLVFCREVLPSHPLPHTCLIFVITDGWFLPEIPLVLRVFLAAV